MFMVREMICANGKYGVDGGAPAMNTGLGGLCSLWLWRFVVIDPRSGGFRWFHRSTSCGEFSLVKELSRRGRCKEE